MSDLDIHNIFLDHVDHHGESNHHHHHGPGNNDILIHHHESDDDLHGHSIIEHDLTSSAANDTVYQYGPANHHDELHPGGGFDIPASSVAPHASDTTFVVIPSDTDDTTGYLGTDWIGNIDNVTGGNPYGHE